MNGTSILHLTAPAPVQKSVEQAALESFPGAVLLVSPTGVVERQWSSGAAKTIGDTVAEGQPLYQVLGVADDSAASVLLQLWLASVSGADAETWRLYEDDQVGGVQPSAVRPGLASRLGLAYAPIYEHGVVARVVVFATAQADVELVTYSTRQARVVVPQVTGEQLETFYCEARGMLAEAEAARARLLIDRAAKHAIHAMFRALHTLKGSARTAGLDAVQNAAHKAEDLLQTLRDRQQAVSGAELSELGAALETLSELIDAGAPKTSTALESDPLGDIRTALDRCRRAVVSEQPDAIATSLQALSRQAAAVAVPSLTDAIEYVEQTVADDRDPGRALVAADDIFEHVRLLASQLQLAALPAHLIAELERLGAELQTHAWALRSGANPRAALESLRLAVASVHAAATGFGVAAVSTPAETAAAAIAAATRTGSVAALDVQLAELTGLMAECAALAPLAPQRRSVDALALFHGEARALLSRMEHALSRWSVHPRDRKPLGALIDYTHLYIACTRRYGFAGLTAHARTMHDVLEQARNSPRPQRSLVARAEQWLADLDAMLHLYQSAAVELRTANDGAGFLVWAADALRASETSPVRLEQLATEAASVGILSVASALASRGHDAGLRVSRLLADAAAFTALPAPTTRTSAPARDSAVSLQRTIDRTFASGREVANVLGKSVDLAVEGNAPPLSERMVRHVADVLLHGVRNAIDHGVESPAQRRATGKADAGSVVLRLSGDATRLRVEIADDGRGIDRERLAARAVRTGMLTAEELASLTEVELDQLVFEPGVSTAERVTDISGRGVGMDAIRARVEQLGGSAVVHSRPGAGTRLCVEFPL